MKAGITFADVSCSFGADRVVDNLNWSLPATGTFCLFGPSGCGKTTLLHLLSGILKPDSGEITGLEDRTPSMVFQEPRLLPWLSTLHNVTAVLKHESHEQKEAVARTMLEQIGLDGDLKKTPAELSGGMRQRVAIVRALAYGGDLLLLDEPTQGLDAESRAKAIHMIRENEQDRLTLLVTHDPVEAAAMGSAVLKVSGPPIDFL